MAGPSVARKGDGPDLLTAGLFVAFGALGLWLARDLDQGTMAMMGAGYLPRAVCTALVLLGGIIGVTALRRDAAEIEAVRLRPLLVIVGSIVGFAYLCEHGGFIPASLWLIIAGSLADPGGRWRTTMMLAGGLTAFGALVFVYGLGVQIELWPF